MHQFRFSQLIHYITDSIDSLIITKVLISDDTLCNRVPVIV